jgi:Uma2 family endonuclease
VQNPIRLSQHSEPQPDLALVKPRADFYADSHPGPDDILLVIEVADTSAGYDRSVKVPLYARAGIREMWLVDLERGRTEVLRDPAAAGYQSVRDHGPEDRLSVEGLPHVQISLDAILG